MKKMIVCLSLSAFLFACKDDGTKTKAMTTDSTDNAAAKPMVDLPYTASYSSSWSTDVSDADLKMVLQTYKDWADNNMSGLANSLSDTVTVDMSSGNHLVKAKADLLKMWSTSRDSLSSVKIDMSAWSKMYSTDKKDGYIVTWYDETDTYKNGKVDSASYHDINQVKNGKLVWYAQFKRPKK